VKLTPRRVASPLTPSYANRHVSELDRFTGGGSAIASGAHALRCVYPGISKMRSEAATACCRFAFTRLSFFAGP